MATKVKKSKENGHGETGQEKKTEREDTASHSWTNKRRENTNEEKEEMKQQQWDIFCPEGKDCFYPFPSRFPSFEELPMWQYSNITTKYFVVCSLFFAARAINFVFFCFAVLAPSQDNSSTSSLFHTEKGKQLIFISFFFFDDSFSQDIASEGFSLILLLFHWRKCSLGRCYQYPW